MVSVVTRSDPLDPVSSVTPVMIGAGGPAASLTTTASVPFPPAAYMLPSPSTAAPAPYSDAPDPQYVEKLRADPSAAYRVTNTSVPPPADPWVGPAVGKFDEPVVPATTARRSASTATPRATSVPLPPR